MNLHVTELYRNTPTRHIFQAIRITEIQMKQLIKFFSETPYNENVPLEKLERGRKEKRGRRAKGKEKGEGEMRRSCSINGLNDFQDILLQRKKGDNPLFL